MENNREERNTEILYIMAFTCIDLDDAKNSNTNCSALIVRVWARYSISTYKM